MRNLRTAIYLATGLLLSILGCIGCSSEPEGAANSGASPSNGPSQTQLDEGSLTESGKAGDARVGSKQSK